MWACVQAFGTNSRLCPIHRHFRVVVVVEKAEAYTRLAPPLLNRFEKQVGVYVGLFVFCSSF
jgi:hypothetical protein